MPPFSFLDRGVVFWIYATWWGIEWATVLDFEWVDE